MSKIYSYVEYLSPILGCGVLLGTITLAAMEAEYVPGRYFFNKQSCIISVALATKLKQMRDIHIDNGMATMLAVSHDKAWYLLLDNPDATLFVANEELQRMIENINPNT